MTQQNMQKSFSPLTQAAETADAPQSPDRVELIGRIASDMARLRQMMGRRFVSRIALGRLQEGHGLELSHFDVVTFVARHQRAAPVTVGMIGEQMRIDPSRASRVVSELVKRGILRREACQEDARRTIVRLSAEGQSLADYFTSVRQEIVMRILEDWEEADLQLFEPLFDRFVAGLESRMTTLADAETGMKE
ncbi:MarR family winged helix-turn-helix transcriptional regulator [Rhizobium paknamense]|uniref:DNA-binding MarR family transcriptional regulator n=1 Tax=Rhizobium paknamense TaxID=1206817 RepID=A0ABU0ID88_9HYPH|nr:MarR family transcriptional regulator [Rhizobium paknamense]MDQ0455199.1 DNA-binding MarR family transcriptional regulator [Rhizobium paknamense]